MGVHAEHRSLVRVLSDGRQAKARPLDRMPAGSEILVSSVGRNLATCSGVSPPIEKFKEARMGRGILLWLLGVPIPVIILLWLFFGH